MAMTWPRFRFASDSRNPAVRIIDRAEAVALSDECTVHWLETGQIAVGGCKAGWLFHYTKDECLCDAAPVLLKTLCDVKAWCELNRREGSVIYKPVCDAIAKAKGDV